MIDKLSTPGIVAKVADCEDRESLIGALAEFLAACGAKYAVVYTFDYGPQTAEDAWAPIYSTYPPDIARYYRDKCCIKVDPFLRATLRSNKPVRFADVEQEFAPCPISEGLFDLMRQHGLQDGLSMLVSDRPGRLIYLNLAYDHMIDNLSELDRRRIHACFAMFMSHAGALMDPGRSQELSPKERDVLAQLAKGASNKEIARRLGVSISTVNTLVNRCFEKLGAHTRTEAAIAAARAGLSLVA